MLLSGIIDAARKLTVTEIFVFEWVGTLIRRKVSIQWVFSIAATYTVNSLAA